jgi:selenophosphate synthase
MGLALPVSAEQHMTAFALVSGFGLVGLTVWMARLAGITKT